MRRSRLAFFLIAFGALLVVGLAALACTGSGSSEAPSTPDSPAAWTEIEPGGDTICADGTPFAYFIHPGTVNRLVVYFDGGGACWNDTTCSKPGLVYDDKVSESDNPANHPQGIADFNNPENPFKDWSAVFIPYCTGDVHWGDNTQTYTSTDGSSIVINHKGFVNFSAVLDWIQANSQKPEKIFVTGCSAGSYGSVFGAAYVHKVYPDVPVYQLGDAGAGVITPDFLATGFSNWGATKNIPSWIPALQIPVADLTLAKIYTAQANFYPTARWSQYNAAHDEIQTLFYSAMGGSGDWGALMLANIQEIESNAANFHSYIAPGGVHCITPRDDFYKREVNGVKFTDWLNALINDQPWASVMCKDCETDPLAP